VDAEHPLFILHLRFDRHAEGRAALERRLLLWAALTMKWSFDIKPTDVYWCTADIGWVTGHSYIAYGPTAVGATQVVFEGMPTFRTPAASGKPSPSTKSASSTPRRPRSVR
jgi:acetyl-CoA synthetase